MTDKIDYGNHDPAREETHRDTERLVTRITSVVPEATDQTPRRNATPLNVPANPIPQMLKQRGSRYGSFVGHAHVTQRLKFVVNDELEKRKKKLAPIQQEAIEMILHKLGRVINGDENYDDSWIDICGYSQLVVDYIHGKLT